MKTVLLQIRALTGVSTLELYRRKDLIVVFILGAVLLLPAAFVSPFGLQGASTYFNEISLNMVWLFSIFIALGVSSRSFPQEFEKRTIYPLLAKPASRGVILFGRYLGALSAALSAFCIFFLVYVVLCGLKQGIWFSTVLVQAFLLQAAMLMVVTAVGMTGSLLLTTSANATLVALIVFGMLFFGARLPELAAAENTPVKMFIYVIYGFAPHIEFFDMRQRLIHSWPAVSWGVCAVVIAYAAFYSAASLFVATLLLKRKKL
ncbi:MAG: ABC transporter permease subunit [Kiritimatiellia bacterium]